MRKLLYVFIVGYLSLGFFFGMQGAELKNIEEVVVQKIIVKEKQSLLNASNARTEIFEKVSIKALVSFANFFMERFGQWIALMGETFQKKTVTRYVDFLYIQKQKIDSYRQEIELLDEKNVLFLLIDEFDKKCSKVAPVFSPVLLKTYLTLRIEAAEKRLKILKSMGLACNQVSSFQWSTQTLFEWRLNFDNARHKTDFIAGDLNKKKLYQFACGLEQGGAKAGLFENGLLCGSENSCFSALALIKERIKYKEQMMRGEGDYKDFIDTQKQVESIYKSIKNELTHFQDQGCGLLCEYEKMFRDLWTVLEKRIAQELKNEKTSAEDRKKYGAFNVFFARYLEMVCGFDQLYQLNDAEYFKHILENFDSLADLLNTACLFTVDKKKNSNMSPFECLESNIRMQQDLKTLQIETREIRWEVVTLLGNSMKKLCVPLYHLFYTRLLWSSVDSIAMLSLNKIEIAENTFVDSVVLDEKEAENLRLSLQFVGEAMTLVPLLNFFYKEIKQRYLSLEKKESIVRQNELIEITLQEKKKIKEKQCRSKKYSNKKNKKMILKAQPEKEEAWLRKEIDAEEQLFYDKTYIAKLLSNAKRCWMSKKGFTVIRYSWGGLYQATLVIKKAPTPCTLNPLCFDTDSRSFYKNDLYHRVMRKLLNKKFFKKGLVLSYADSSVEASDLKKRYGLWPKKDNEEKYKNQSAILFPGFLFLGDKAQKRYEDISKSLKGTLPANIIETMLLSMAQPKERGACTFIVADQKLIHGCFQRKKL